MEDILGGFTAAFGIDAETQEKKTDNNFVEYDEFDFNNIPDNPGESDNNIAIETSSNFLKEQKKKLGISDENSGLESIDKNEIGKDTTNDSSEKPAKEEPDTSEKDSKVEDKQKIESDDFIEDESAVATALFEMLSEKLGIESDEEFKIESINDVVSGMIDIIQENSIPEYSSEDVKNIDDFVRNGGKITDYLKNQDSYSASEDDLKTEDGQKKILSKLMIHQGHSKEQISKKINKYETAGLLEDEAEDALEILNTIKEKEQKSLLSEQQAKKEAFDKMQQQQYTDVVTTIKGLTEINGVTVTSKEKTELTKYLFERTASGLTKWQEDNKDIKNIVNAAFIMKNGQSLIDNAKRKGKSEAYTRMKDGLRKSMNNNGRTDTKIKSGDDNDKLHTVVAGVNKLFGGPTIKF